MCAGLLRFSAEAEFSSSAVVPLRNQQAIPQHTRQYSMANTPNYSPTHTKQYPKNTRSREFSFDRRGTTSAVSWAGPTPP